MDTLQQNTPLKQCTGPCRRMLPATSEFFCRNKSDKKYGLRVECKECHKMRYDEEHREEKAEKKEIRRQEYEARLLSQIAFQPSCQDGLVKQCAGPCGRTLPATSEYWSLSKTGKYGFHSICKACRRFLRVNPPEKPTPPPDRYKQCTGPCGRMLPAIDEFFHKEKRRNGKSALHSQCKECRCNTVNARYQDDKEHREERKRKGREYYHEHRETLRIKGRAWHHANKERANQKSKEWHHSHKEEAREHGRLYRQTHRDELAAYQKVYRQHYRLAAHGSAVLHINSARQRVRRFLAPGRYTPAQLCDQKKRQKNKCYWCGKKLGKGKNAWHADHVVPISRGGSNNIDNIVVSCPSCNNRKYNKLPHEWAEGGRVL